MKELENFKLLNVQVKENLLFLCYISLKPRQEDQT